MAFSCLRNWALCKLKKASPPPHSEDITEYVLAYLMKIFEQSNCIDWKNNF